MNRLLLLVAVCCVGCSGFSSVEDAASDSGQPRDGARDGEKETSAGDLVADRTEDSADTSVLADKNLPDVLTGGTGPGARGALPSGYCCSSDEQCRSRQCVDLGGGANNKMCSDYCIADETCIAAPQTTPFVCVGEEVPPLFEGHCEPDTPVACVPADLFNYGAKMLGDCCEPRFNGLTGLECEGGHCTQVNNNPYMCTHACENAGDCGGMFDCMLTPGVKLCLSTALNTCQE